MLINLVNPRLTRPYSTGCEICRERLRHRVSDPRAKTLPQKTRQSGETKGHKRHQIFP